MGDYHGINVYEKSWEKLTREKSFEGYMPDSVCISMCQSGDDVCLPTVAPGEYVRRGQVIGEARSEKGSCVHASIDGYVEEILTDQKAPGVLEYFIRIRKQKEKTEVLYPFSMKFNPDGLSDMMYRIGVPGKHFSKARIFIVNGFANEPFITSGYRLMLESPGKIVIGAILGAMAAKAEKIYFCINEDAFEAVARMERTISKYGQNLGNTRPIRILSMKRRYPFGNEREIRKKVLEREKGPVSVASLTEIAALYDGIYDGEPWTRVGITVSGVVPNPKNLWVPIGTNVEDIINYCGGRPERAVVIQGGPLSGHTVDGERMWVTRETSGILVLCRRDIPVYSCIHCGMCREVCPRRLKPDVIEKCYLEGRKITGDLSASDCIECGLCSYVCPSGRRLTEYIRQVKKGRMKGCTKEEGRTRKGDYIELSGKGWEIEMDRMENRSQSAPHIHRRGTLMDVTRQSIYSLIPLVAAVIVRNESYGFHFLAMMAAGMLGAAAAETLWEALFHHYISIGDGTAVLTGLLLSIVFPVGTPLWKIVCAAFTGILLGKQIWGGIGCAPIHPVILGKFLFSPWEAAAAEPLWPFALTALLWLVFQRMIPAIYPAAYLLILFVGLGEHIFSASIFIAAAFFIWSYETMMPEKKARWAMTLISAVLTILFFKAGLGVNSIYPAAAFGAIIGSILSGRL